MTVNQAYSLLYSAALTVIAILLGVMLIRSVTGASVTDKIVSINMIGTLVSSGIVILSALFKESWLLDVALVYTMISFVSVLILARVYIPSHPKRKRFEEEEEGKEGRSDDA